MRLSVMPLRLPKGDSSAASCALSCVHVLFAAEFAGTLNRPSKGSLGQTANTLQAMCVSLILDLNMGLKFIYGVRCGDQRQSVYIYISGACSRLCTELGGGITKSWGLGQCVCFVTVCQNSLSPAVLIGCDTPTSRHFCWGLFFLPMCMGLAWACNSSPHTSFLSPTDKQALDDLCFV